MNPSRIDESNYKLLAARSYRNPSSAGEEEFQEDLARVKYVRKLIGKYLDSGDLKTRLLLNHLVVVFNVFEVSTAVRMLFYKMPDYLSQLRPFMEQLSYWPNRAVGPFGPREIWVNPNNVAPDEEVAKAIREDLG